MLGMPCTLVLHQVLLALLQDLEEQCRDIWLIAELGHGSEERLEVENDACTQWQSSQCLPVNSQIALLDLQLSILDFPQRLVRMAGRHEERLADFEPPASSLNRRVCCHLTEEPVHAERHLLLVVRDLAVDFLELHANLCAHVPAQ